MKAIRRTTTILQCAVLLCCMLTVLTMMIGIRVYPDGKSGIPILDALLGRISIQTAAPESKWAEEYPFDSGLKKQWEDTAESVRKMLESFCTVSFPLGKQSEEVVDFLRQRLLHDRIEEIPDPYENRRYVQMPVDSVVSLRNKVNGQRIPFLYVQTPQPYTLAYLRGEVVTGRDLQIAERSREFRELLGRTETETLFLHSRLLEEPRFDRTLHWSAQDALRCSRMIVERLNEVTDIAIDIGKYDSQGFEDFLNQYPGKETLIQEMREEQYSLPIPIDTHSFQMVYAENEVWEGDYTQVFLRPLEQWNADSPYFGAFRINNSLIYDVVNRDCTERKSLLVIGDSYDWPVVSYLSLGVHRVTFLHNDSFSGSILSFIGQMHPDAVLVVYNDAEFWEQYTEAAYDFR